MEFTSNLGERKTLRVLITEVVSALTQPGHKVEWAGAAIGLLGAAIVSENSAYSCYGFLALLGSNACLLWAGCHTKTWSLVVMQVGFAATSLRGIAQWLL